MDSIEQRLRNIFSEQMGMPPGEIKLSSTLIDDIGCDSLDSVELAIAAEDEFGVELPDEEIDVSVLKTFGDCVALVIKKKTEEVLVAK